MMIKIFLIFLLTFLMSYILTWVTLRYSLHKKILDIPNERSSHLIPTPRGGGIGIVLTFILSLFVFYQLKLIDSHLGFALIGGGIGIACIGYCDDISLVKARIRFVIQSLVVLWAIYWIGGLTVLDFGSVKLSLHKLSILLTAIGMLWCINFYNFMDGIDSLAGSEGIFVSLLVSFALWLTGSYSLSLATLLLTAAIAGFTAWNWPPAKIFLGNVGSEFLGFTFATIGLYTINKGLLSITFWWLILAVFLSDATFTLLYRIYKGKSWYSAHREHAYQHLVLQGVNHKKIMMGIMGINILILSPMALISLYHPLQSLWLILIATTTLFLTWILIKSRPINHV